MSEEIQTENTEAPTENTNLPSDVEEKANQPDIDWQSIAESDSYLQQFKSLEDMKEKYKELHSQYSSTVQKQKEEGRKQEQQKQEQQSQQQLQQEQQETINELLPKFLENNMQLDEEMEQQLTEKGLDIRDVKLGALELKERVQKAHDVVGGKEEYEAMIEWGRNGGMSEQQMRAFDKDVVGEFSEYAIKGLHAEYKQATASQNPQDRLRGNATPVGVKPYNSQKEILRDRMHINSGRASAEDKAKHQARLNVTPNEVINGR